MNHSFRKTVLATAIVSAFGYSNTVIDQEQSADSLQRVPGISITREGGEGRQISLRGLGPDFTRALPV